MVEVPEQRLMPENFQYVFCQTCRHQITDADFQSQDALTQAQLCDVCDHGIHLRCLTAEDRAAFEQDGIWFCDMCNEADPEEIDSYVEYWIRRVTLVELALFYNLYRNLGFPNVFEAF